MRNCSIKNMMEHCTFFKNARGFTLIELSIVIMAIGIILAGLAPLYSQFMDRKDLKQSEENVQSVADAIGAFRAQWGRYPCPASLAVPRNNPQYGREQCAAAVAVATGQCSGDGGICIKQSMRAPIPPAATPPRVQIGFIPFRQLGLEEDQAYDSYDNRMLYAVTENLADADAFRATDGGIEISGNVAGESALNLPGTAHFFVGSGGKNRAGAYAKNGQRLPCQGSAFEMQNTNCNPQTAAVFAVAEAGTNTGAFDDITTYYTQDEIPLWQTSTANTRHIHQKPVGAVGVGMALDPAITSGLHIASVIRAQNDTANDGPLPPIPPGPSPDTRNNGREGRAEAMNLCERTSPATCFTSELIAGTLSQGGDLQCPAGQFMQGIANNQALCSPDVYTKCPPGEFLRGVNPDGTPICSGGGMTFCPETPKDVCGSPQNLPRKENGQSHTLSAPPPSDYTATYLCDAGNWVLQNSSGSCPACVPDIDERDTCPPGDGHTIERRTKACPSGIWGPWTVVTDTCTCTPGIEERTSPCPHAGEVGQIFERRHKTCPGSVWGPWEEVLPRNCVCTPEEEQRVVACPSGQVGEGIREKRNKSCPDGAWSGWSEISRSCAPESISGCNVLRIHCGEYEAILPRGINGQIENPIFPSPDPGQNYMQMWQCYAPNWQMISDGGCE